jgi:hypothetical protein
MFNIALDPFQRVRSRIDLYCYRTQERLRRLARAWRYFTERLSADDAQRIMVDCRQPAGWHLLLVLAVEDTLELARETFADHPELPRLIADGCARVDHKWESTGDELYEARRWAIDIAEGYAADQGIILTRLDDAAPTATGAVAQRRTFLATISAQHPTGMTANDTQEHLD